ncbi:hypothetical protein [Roseateles sp. LKC17W]|uniref:Uncharacterized protein n=1 Tax=Pelomonas margarita TaxID=3299031 RepID=A0ABW7FQE2_9BURK
MDAKPVPAQPAARSVRRPALLVAAQSASTSYRTNLPPEVLGDALRTGAMPADFMAHIGTLLDEAPMSMLAKVVEQIHADDGMHHELVWSNMRSLARSLKLTRDIGVQALLNDQQAIDAADVAAGRRPARSLFAVQPGDLAGYTFTPNPASEFDKPGEGW